MPFTTRDLLDKLGDVPTDSEGYIQEPFLHFVPDITHRKDIWCWFEDTFGINVAELLGAARKKVDIVDLVMLVESESCTEEELIGGFQQLIDAGMVEQLQGWYGRTAHELIKRGLCHPRQGILPQNER